MALPGTLAGLIEIGLNRYIGLNPDAGTALAASEGKVLGIEFRGLGLELFCEASSHGIAVHPQFDGEPDTWLRGTPWGLARMSGGDSAGGLFSGEVVIEGDVEFGQAFHAVLDASQIDWEEQLSRVIGDVGAYRAGETARSASQWAQRSSASLREDITDYLQEETRLLPHPLEIERFSAEVDALRDDAERLEARVRRIEERSGS